MGHMSCRKRDKDDCKPRPPKCGRGHGHGHGHDRDRRKKCKSHGNPWDAPGRRRGSRDGHRG